jgi:hypothetical protein
VSIAVWVHSICLNANFLGALSDQIFAVIGKKQPTVKEELEAEIDTLLDIYRRSQLSSFFVLYVRKGCDSPSVAMLTSQSVWNNRSVKAFILQHNIPRAFFCVLLVGASVSSSTWKSSTKS